MIDFLKSDNRGRLIFKTFNPFLDATIIQEIWLDLQKRAEHSYFNSWGWISVWLASLPSDTQLNLHVAYLEDKPIVAFFCGEREKKKYGFLRSRTFSLNATANPYFDSIYIEYNTILYDISVDFDFAEILQYILSLDWDELILPGVSKRFVSDFQLLNESKHLKYYTLIEHLDKSYFVNLNKIREVGLDFLQLLSPNRRNQIRRSLKQYELDGKIQIQEALSIDSALMIFDELVRLHQLEWTKRGWGGAFSNQYLYQFHKDLIRERFEAGEVQLLHVYTEKFEIGCIYCFVYNGKNFFYQSGFNYLPENHYRPGLVSHYLAILHNTKKGMKSYDFLAGDSSYKRSFSSDSNSMYWLHLYKKRHRYWLEKKILIIKNKIESTPVLMRFLTHLIHLIDR